MRLPLFSHLKVEFNINFRKHFREKAINIDYGNIDFENVNIETVTSTRL